MKAETDVGQTIKVTWKRSTIGRKERQKKIIQALGFKRLHQTRTFPDHPAIRGMINHIPHLVEVSD